MISLFYKYLLYRLINSPAESKSNDCRESQGVVLGGGWFHNKTPFYLFPKPQHRLKERCYIGFSLFPSKC